MTPAEGWRLHAAGTVVNKDSIALNVKMTHTFLLEEDWFSIKKRTGGFGDDSNCRRKYIW